jgi:hypothetical protein
MKSNSPVENSRFLENISQIDVGIKEIGIESHRFLEVVNSEPYLSLSVEDAAQVAPCNGEVWSRLDRFEVASLNFGKGLEAGMEVGKGEKKENNISISICQSLSQ